MPVWVNDQLDVQLRYIVVYYYNPLHILSNCVLLLNLHNEQVTYREYDTTCCFNTI